MNRSDLERASDSACTEAANSDRRLDLLMARLMVARLSLAPDRSVIEADETAQSLLGGTPRQLLSEWLEHLEPAELHNLIGRVDIDSAPIQIRDIAGIYTPAKLWQYRENSTSDWQIAIQIETQNATDENPLQKRFFAQQQLLSIISHELRTPAATLKMLIDDLAASNLSEQLPLLKESSEHLMSVLQDMRQAINPERNLPRAERTFHPNRLLESVASQVRRIAQTQGITLRMELYQGESIKVKTDLERCKLIALNLLKNAVIHSEGREVCIGVNLKESNGRWQMQFSISDDGIGIEQPDIDRLLQPFERLEGLEQGGDGAGLGLFVVKQSLAELNGRLVLTQSKAGGLLAVAEMPVICTQLAEEDHSNLHQESQRFQQRLAALRVLVVEDDPVIRMVSQKLLAKRVGLVETAENGAIGLEKIKTTRYDLILSDYFMPVMDGAEMIRQVRQAGITTPIISVTAAVLGEEAKELRDAGANQILAKPISMKGFIDSVEQLL